MLYTIIRLILALAAGAVAFVMLHYARDDKRRTRRSHAVQSDTSITAYSAAIFFVIVVLFNFMPVENLFIGFSEPENAFRYNNSGEILEINEYPDCAFVIASTGDGEVTTHVLPQKDSKWKLETMYNRRRDVTTKNYCMVERLYVPDSDNCFVIITHSTEGNISDSPTNVADSRNTKFTAVSYPDTLTFYYGYVENMDEDYSVHVDGEKIKFE